MCIKLHNCVIHCAELLHACKHNSVPYAIITYYCIKCLASCLGDTICQHQHCFPKINNHLHSPTVSLLKLSFLYIKLFYCTIYLSDHITCTHGVPCGITYVHSILSHIDKLYAACFCLHSTFKASDDNTFGNCSQLEFQPSSIGIPLKLRQRTHSTSEQ